MPRLGVGVADLVRVVQHEQIELIGAATLEFFVGGKLDELFIALGAAQFGIGEAGIAAAAGALTVVEVVADHADQGVGVAINALEGLAEQFVGLAVAVDVGGDEGADALFVGGLDAADVALLAEGFAEVHEASAAPGAVCSCGRFHSLWVHQ